MIARPIALVAAAVLTTTALLLLPLAAAAAPNPANQARLDRTIRYLQEAQNLDGGFGGASGKESGQGFSAWVALALAAAGVNPRCQARPGGADAYRFLVDHFQRGLREEISYPQVPTTAFERELMVVNASGTDPHSFAGYDLVGEILARRSEDNGSFPYVSGGLGQINATIFAILALAPVHEPRAQAAIQSAAEWLIGQQDDDGGWAWSEKGASTEADLTGAAIQALRAAGRPDTEAERRGLGYLHEMQGSDGGFPEHPGETESNVASTAWAAQGIWAAGQDPETWVAGGSDPLSYMASLQQEDGHIKWKASEDLNGIWMTAYVAPAFAGQTWPIPDPPCSPKPPPAPPRAGQGGGTQSGSGTIAGGGGRGAPLFSRPKPGSRGRTPGGARLVGNEGPPPTNHSQSRRGEAKQPSGAETAEPGKAQASAASVGRGPGGGGAGTDAGGGGELPLALDAAGEEAPAAGGRSVTGTLVGAPHSPQTDRLAFGAPGLHSAGAGGREGWLAIGIGAAALALVLGGVQWERRRELVL